MTEPQNNLTELPADRALFGGLVKGLILTFYQNERPPYGLLGLIDWHFHGAVSQTIRAGAITGRVGECAYFPLRKKKQIYHLLLIGAGPSNTPGERSALPSECLASVQKNIISLKLEKFGISRSDFGNVSFETLSKQLKGISLWVAP
jgi:hypothetical protein